MSLQILILKQPISFSFSTVNVLSIQSFKPHNTRTCPTTVMPLHVATAGKKIMEILCVTTTNQHFSYYT